MNTRILIPTLCLTFVACGTDEVTNDPPAELAIIGTYTDDFSNTHAITAESWTSNWVGAAASVHHISTFSNEESYVVAENDAANTWNADLWSRFDWSEQNGVLWYCTSVMDGASEQVALAAATPDATDPAAGGCSGYAWSKLVAN